MRVAIFFSLLLVGCGKEADVVLELRRAVPTSQLTVGICDMEHPEDCDAVESVDHQGDVTEFGIYLDAPIDPPLSVHLAAFSPVACGIVELDPALVSDRVIVQFPSTDGADLVLTCDGCRLVECPDN
jgi:hypothetical protein